MPVANIRNDEQGVLLNAEFIRKQDHLYITSMMPGLLNSVGGIRDAWLLNQAAINAAGNPQMYGVVRQGAMQFTLTAGAVAALATAAVDHPISRHGHTGKTRLGEVNTFALFEPHIPANTVTGIDNHILAADVGLTAFVAFYLPATAVAPGAGVAKSFFSKYDADTNNRAWFIGWDNTGGLIRLKVFLSLNGAALQTFTSQYALTPGNSYLVGFSFIGGTSVGVFCNDSYQTILLDDAAAAPPASIFAANANMCIGRNDAAGLPRPSPDAQYYFAGLSNLRWNSSVALSFYRFVQPLLLWNTNLSGT